MKVYVNGYELEGITELPATVRETLDQLRSEITEAGKLITAIAIDEKVLKRNDEHERTWTQLSSEVERIDLTVEEPKVLLANSLSDTSEFLKTLRQDFISTATAFRLGNEVTANNSLAQCLDDLQLVLMGMNAASKLPGVESETESLRETLESSNSHLRPLLDTMYKAQAAGDYVSLADGLEYDLTEITDEWMNTLAHILREVVDEESAAVQES